MPRLSRNRIAAGLVTLTLFALVAAAQAATSGAIVSVHTSSLGKLLVNSHGRTLYLFQKDTVGKSNCSASCAAYWPPLLTSGKPRAGTGATQSLLGTTKRADGKLQVTYHGHPLYTFALDTKAGQTKGEALNKFGALWYAVSPSGTKIAKPSSGGGYGGGYGG
jgi:predicted lipoprotein with Yx(FWY)xxD motif